MKRSTRDLEQGVGKLSAGGGGGGRGWVDPIVKTSSQVQQSIQDRGGYPTRNGKPMMTKMQQRAEARKAGTGFKKGGMVKGNGRDYCK